MHQCKNNNNYMHQCKKLITCSSMEKNNYYMRQCKKIIILCVNVKM